MLKRKRRAEARLAAGVIKKKGRPPKGFIVSEEDQMAELRYKLSRREYRIKQLEAENELLRNFLKETGRT